MSDRVREGASAVFLFDGTNAKQSFQLKTFLLSFSTPDSRENSYNHHFPRLLGESCSVHTSFLAFVIEGKKELKALHKALASRALISRSRLISYLLA